MQRDGQAEYQRHQVYVPVGAIAQVQAMIAERQPVGVVLGVVAGGGGQRLCNGRVDSAESTYNVLFASRVPSKGTMAGGAVAVWGRGRRSSSRC